jgi:uncharacterized protein (TIGR03086 family)
VNTTIYDGRMSNEVIQRVTGLLQGFDARVRATDSSAWGNQSPCGDWTARDVVVHVANNLSRIGALLSSGAQVEVAADADIAAAWSSAQAQFIAGLSTGDLSQNVPGPFGPMPAEQLIGRLICNDVLVHTWDLARAVGGDESLDQGAVEGALSGLLPLDAMLRQPGVFGAKVEAPAGADAQTQLLCFLGRQV